VKRTTALTLLLLVTACGGGGAEPTTARRPADSGTQPSSSSSAAAPHCPSAHGGVCLGPLEPGTYTTQIFVPPLTYTVPEGWANFEDLPGNFLLIPPGGTNKGVDAGTSDYIGVYTSVAALRGCAPGPAPGVGTAPGDIAAEIGRNRGLDVTAPTPIKVGGLSGLVLDVKIRPGFAGGCDLTPGQPRVVPVLTGTYPSQFEHAVLGDFTLRLYLLAFEAGTLAIEVDDRPGGTGLDDYAAIVNQFTFASS
jgi:hypothetical protein